ncbi:hypothetical protein VTN02DRAFT_6873 [Thermoascus thermophilus]
MEQPVGWDKQVAIPKRPNDHCNNAGRAKDYWWAGLPPKGNPDGLEQSCIQKKILRLPAGLAVFCPLSSSQPSDAVRPDDPCRFAFFFSSIEQCSSHAHYFQTASSAVTLTPLRSSRTPVSRCHCRSLAAENHIFSQSVAKTPSILAPFLRRQKSPRVLGRPHRPASCS